MPYTLLARGGTNNIHILLFLRLEMTISGSYEKQAAETIIFANHSLRIRIVTNPLLSISVYRLIFNLMK